MQFYENYPDTFIVATINGFVVGYIAGFLASERVGRIFSLAVHPAYQRRGVGGNLLEEIIDMFRRMGVLEVTLEVRSDNITAKRFYEIHGFFQFGLAEKYYNDTQSAFLMKLELFSGN